MTLSKLNQELGKANNYKSKLTENLEDRARYARTARDYLLTSLYESWVDSIKNCEVSVKEARQMLQAARH